MGYPPCTRFDYEGNDADAPMFPSTVATSPVRRRRAHDAPLIEHTDEIRNLPCYRAYAAIGRRDRRELAPQDYYRAGRALLKLSQWVELKILLLATLIAATLGAAGELIGRAAVIDGDTIEIQGRRIRFSGIDAPETWQTCFDRSGAEYPCGQAAAEALSGFLAESQPTRCRQVDVDHAGLIVADCFRADRRSVSAWMVHQGQALDWPQHSNYRYAGDEAMARIAGRGLWQGAFLEPWEARRALGE
jgi:endonuclease YncB( thermonuclease family)